MPTFTFRCFSDWFSGSAYECPFRLPLLAIWLLAHCATLMPRPVLSFIIPAHDAQRTIGETLTAIARQVPVPATVPVPGLGPGGCGGAAITWEALVVDDRCSDATVKIVKSLGDKRISVIKNLGPRHGPAAARRLGLERATGEFVYFLDADDVPDPQAAGLLVDAIVRGEADAACGGFRLVDESGEDLCWSHIPEPGDWSVQKLTVANRLTIGATVVRRTALLEAMAQAPAMFESGCQSEDWAMWMHFAKVAHERAIRWVAVDKVVLAYRQRSGSRSRQVMDNLSSGLQIIQSFGADPDEVRSAAIGLLRRAACEALVEGEPELLRACAADIPPDERGGDQAAAAFVSPLRWSLACRGYLRPPGMQRAMDELLPAMTAMAAGVLHLDWSSVMRRALCGPEQLAMAASRLHATLGPSGRLVIYGLGRSGRSALRLVAGRPHVAAIDDDATRQSPVPRIGVDDLTPFDAVLITPDSREQILRRIDGTPARIVLPEDLLLGRRI